jgi:hypothetical protein
VLWIALVLRSDVEEDDEMINSLKLKLEVIRSVKGRGKVAQALTADGRSDPASSLAGG